MFGHMDEIVKEISYGEGTLCFEIQCEDLTCEVASRAFKHIRSSLSRTKKGIEEIVLDVHLLKKADPLALSLLSATKNLCIKKSKKFFVSGLSEKMNKEVVRHSSFKGKHLQARAVVHHYMQEQILHIGNLSIDVGKAVMSVIGFAGEFSAALYEAVRRPHKIRWRETFYYMDVCGADALPIVSMICFLMGLILAFQGAVQLSKVGTDIYLADAVGLSIIKELGPLMVAMVSTGRAGSAFAAEIGTMKVGEEVSALTTFGFVPSRFLFVPKFIAMIVTMPLLTIFGDFVGVLGGMAVGYFKLGIPILAYTSRTLLVLKPIHLAESLTKSLVFAAIITVVGCICGFESDTDAQGVGHSATKAVVSSIFVIIIADAFLTYVFSRY